MLLERSTIREQVQTQELGLSRFEIDRAGVHKLRFGFHEDDFSGSDRDWET